MRKILYGLLLFSIVSCGSVQNYTENDLNQSFFQDKKMIFTWNSASVQYVNITGPHMGTSPEPNVKEVFEQAVKEISNETKLDLNTINNGSQASIDAKILDINWKFGLTSAEMITQVNFSANGQKYTSVGHFKNMGYGNKGDILRKSLKNAVYNFLLEYQK